MSGFRLPSSVVLLGELRFASGVPAWLVVTASLLLAVAVMVLYQRETRTLGRPWAWGLPGLRGAAVVLMLLLIAGPIWHRRQIVGTPAHVVLAVDTSSSMSETDSQSPAGSVAALDRIGRVVDWLEGGPARPGWIERLVQTHHVDVVGFDDDATLVWSSRGEDSFSETVLPRVADGGGTRLAAVLAMGSLTQGDRSSPAALSDAESGARDSVNVKSPSAVVLLTDGRETDLVGEDAADAAAALASDGWLVHAVAVGAPDEPPDVGVMRVDAPQRVAADGRISGRVLLKQFGHVGRNVRVDVVSGDQTAWSTTVTINADGDRFVDFDFPVQSILAAGGAGELKGIDRDSVILPLRASVTVLGDGAALATEREDNDSLAFRVAAGSRDRRLLILDGSSRWETRYLRNLFSRDPAWQVDTVFFGPGTDQPRVRRGSAAGELPASIRDWSRYDAVILGEIPANQWTVEDAESLRQFVRRGGGLLVVDGRYGQINELVSPLPLDQIPTAEDGQGLVGDGTRFLADLIPVRYQESSIAARVEEAGKGTNEKRDPRLTDRLGNLSIQAARPSVRAIVPTSLGSTHPVMLLRSEATASATLWAQLPPPTSIPRIEAAADAEVWAEAQLADGTATPWLITRMVGAGRVFYLATDQTWRWRYKVESQWHGRFWNQLLTAAMQPPYAVRDDFVAIGTDRVDYSSGETATVRARLIERESVAGVDVSAADRDAPLPTVDALLVRDDEIFATVPLSVDDAARRTFVGQSPPLPPGEYSVRIRASGYDAAAMLASTPIWVDPARRGELDRVAVDQANLSRVTRAGGGVVVHESSADELLDRLLPLSQGRIIESDTLLYESGWLFAIVLAILAIEWWLRKRVGLA